ncbi:MAG: hypothetical protein F4226_05000 [Synechococcus sp. SB0678_bin_12]|nr:hypothetical protein [Synechococcus sp. SB0678_bin_12]MYI87811.1 hypothetical protein [Synechococcus sp. SB0672_bin_10]
MLVSHCVAGGITVPAVFQASGVAVVAPPQEVNCPGAFTRNPVWAACVHLCVERLQRSGGQA